MNTTNCEVIDIEMVCRLCANMEADLIPIFDPDVNNLPDQISKYLHFSVQKVSGMPNKICAPCAINLFNWHIFYQSCEKTNRRFREMGDCLKPNAEFALLRNILMPADTESIEDDDIEEHDVLKKKQRDLEDESENSSELKKILDDVNIIYAPESLVHGELFNSDCMVVEEEFHPIPQEVAKKRIRRKLPRSRVKLKRAATKPLRMCPHCDSGFFYSERSLNDHLRDVHVDLIFKCEVCNRLITKTNLIDHMKMHYEENEELSDDAEVENSPKKKIKPRKFICSLCNLAFGYNHTLKQHILSKHTTERSFKCQERSCGKAFKTPSGLYSHKRLVHNPEFGFLCELCPQKYKMKHQLQRHLQTVHERIHRHFCECGKGFALQDSLTKHKRTHDQSTQFKCDKCLFSTTQKRYLYDHLKRRHALEQ